MNNTKIKKCQNNLLLPQKLEMTMIEQQDQEFIAAKIYQHFGRPSGIHNERLKIYEKWNAGGITRGRFSYHYGELVYSYFLAEKDGIINVHINTRSGREPDMIINKNINIINKPEPKKKIKK